MIPFAGKMLRQQCNDDQWPLRQGPLDASVECVVADIDCLAKFRILI
jgi:hypothetical protein